MLDFLGQRFFSHYNIKEYLYQILRKSVQHCDLYSVVRLFQKTTENVYLYLSMITI